MSSAREDRQAVHADAWDGIPADVDFRLEGMAARCALEMRALHAPDAFRRLEAEARAVNAAIHFMRRRAGKL